MRTKRILTEAARKRCALFEAAVAMHRTQVGLSLATGVSPFTIWKGVHLGECSPQLAVAIEQATGGQINRIEICSDPDIFAGMRFKRKTRRDSLDDDGGVVACASVGS